MTPQRLRTAAIIVASAATPALIAVSAKDGSFCLGRCAIPMGPVQLSAMVAMAISAIVLMAAEALRALATGHTEGQRTPSGVPITKTDTPAFFWVWVSIWAAMALAFAWFAVHVAGYMLGIWDWPI